MSTLVARRLAAAHGDRVLFAGLDLVVAPGDVVGLVGANGAGKSTLLRLLAGIDEPEEGTVALSPADATVGYLPQEPERRPARRCTTSWPAAPEWRGAAGARGRGATRWPTRRPGADDRYAHALDRWLALGGADLDERAGAGRRRAGPRPPTSTLPMTALSGGQAARAGLASLLLSRYDVFLLDEPTNDLDLDGLARLEEFVRACAAGAVVVSHDREFLARTRHPVVELDLAQQQVNVFGGGYDVVPRRARGRAAARPRAVRRVRRHPGGLEQRARTQRAWMEKGVANARRKQRDNDKVARKFRTETTEKQAAKARQTERLIERLEVVEEPRKEWELQMEIARRAARRRGGGHPAGRRRAARLLPARPGRPAARLGRPGRRSPAPTGPASRRCSAALLGRVPLVDGAASLGPGVVVGRGRPGPRAVPRPGRARCRAFGEHGARLGRGRRPHAAGEVRLGPAHVLRPAATLSPGERTRAALALLQARGVNLLVLDEPTNHLDLPAIEQLEQALDSYTGTLLLVSHDRRLLEAVHLTRRWQVEAGHVTEID